jgi:hypothetical protein
MRRLFAISGVAVAASLLCGPTLRAQSPVPIRELSHPDATTKESFANIFGVRQLADGRLLVNDGVRRQLVALSADFATRTVLIDSAANGGQSYGPRAAPLIPFVADSTLFVDAQSLSLLVIDPTGKIARVMSSPRASDLRLLAGSASGTDRNGNLIYRGVQPAAENHSHTPGEASRAEERPDSAPVVRANFDTRMVDTLGRVKAPVSARGSMTMDASGKMVFRTVINPLVTVDEWAVLSDGTVAFVRGHDYHVDLIKPDGTKISTPKLPFDWKRLTDEDKQALIDSSKAAQQRQQAEAKVAADANPTAAAEKAAVAGAAVSSGSGGGFAGHAGGEGHSAGFDGGRMDFGGPVGPSRSASAPVTDYVPLKQIADYYPAIRAGAAMADVDGSLWILTTTTAQSRGGELVYDVLNNNGVLYQRVRLPVGRSIAGFGHEGTVFLMYRDGKRGWQLERTRLLRTSNTTN